VSIADELGYRFRRPNAFQRANQAFGASRAGGWVFSRVLRHVDRGVQRVTGGRATGPELLAGLPVLELTTAGRRSGLPRTSFLIAIPCGGSLALLGTNFGQASTPAWVLNLEARPEATVTYRGTSVPVVARLATPEQHEEVLTASEPLYPGYVRYRQRITDRRLRIFLLERAP
jgi:deazaflavin-dependent oxidoreductase (nitroreductase family)